MIRTRLFRSLIAAVAVVGVISCTDATPTSPPPAPATAQNGLISDLVGGVINLLGQVVKVVGFRTDPNGIPVNAVQWAPSHVNGVRSVSATIGVNGGTLSIPGSDFTITFPYGALTSPTNITITSDGGDYVTYDMQPHGLTFRRPVIVTQRLNNTAVYGTPDALNTFGAYFAKDLLDLSGILQALEIETTTIFLNPRSGQPEVETWLLNHFSRYMLASG